MVENRLGFFASRAQSSSVYVDVPAAEVVSDRPENSESPVSTLVLVLLDDVDGGSGGLCLSLSMGRMAAISRPSRCMLFVGVESGV